MKIWLVVDDRDQGSQRGTVITRGINSAHATESQAYERAGRLMCDETSRPEKAFVVGVEVEGLPDTKALEVPEPFEGMPKSTRDFIDMPP